MLFGSAWAQSADNDTKCTAIVRGDTAEFSFQLPNRETWTWNRSETEDNYQEYTWEISLTGKEDKSTYNFGVYLFKYPQSKEVKGSIDKLIYKAQTSVWDQSLSTRDDLNIESYVQSGKLILKVSNKKTFSELFSQRPTIAHCRANTPYADANYVSQTQIEFK